jgi:hypothetical protein
MTNCGILNYRNKQELCYTQGTKNIYESASLNKSSYSAIWYRLRKAGSLRGKQTELCTNKSGSARHLVGWSHSVGSDAPHTYSIMQATPASGS